GILVLIETPAPFCRHTFGPPDQVRRWQVSASQNDAQIAKVETGQTRHKGVRGGPQSQPITARECPRPAPHLRYGASGGGPACPQVREPDVTPGETSSRPSKRIDRAWSRWNNRHLVQNEEAQIEAPEPDPHLGIENEGVEGGR